MVTYSMYALPVTSTLFTRTRGSPTCVSLKQKSMTVFTVLCPAKYVLPGDTFTYGAVCALAADASPMNPTAANRASPLACRHHIDTAATMPRS